MWYSFVILLLWFEERCTQLREAIDMPTLFYLKNDFLSDMALSYKDRMKKSPCIT